MTVELFTRDFGLELWETNGTPGGTAEIASLSSTGNTGESVSSAATVGDKTFFLVTQIGGSNSGEATLWATDGTAAGTVDLRVQDPISVLGLRDGVWVTNASGNWVSDGRLASTSFLNNNPITNQIGILGGELFYGAYDGAGEGLFESNGTASGSGLIGQPGSGLIDLQVIDGGLIFENFTGDLVNQAGLYYSREGQTIELASGLMVQPSAVSFLYSIDQTLYFQEPAGPGSSQEQVSAETEDGTVFGVIPAGLTPNSGIAETGGDVYFTTSTGMYSTSGNIIFSAAQPLLLGAAGGNILFEEQVGSSTVLALYEFQSTQTIALAIGTATVPFESVGGEGFFIFTPANGAPDQLWESNGTGQGTGQFDNLANVTDLTSNGASLSFDVGGQPWTSDGTLAGTGMVSTAPTAPQFLSPAEANDFTAGGASDVLFTQSNGTLGLWEMNGTAIVGGGSIGSPGGTWAEKGVGDFTGDGTNDVLFQDASGNLAIWEISGTSIIGGGNIGNPGGTWTDQGLGDFNADGTSDILFKDASGNYSIWEMNGTSIIGGGNIGNPGGTWAEKGIGDFNGDGAADILFQDASGNLAIWEMNGTAVVGGGNIGNPGPGWTEKGIGDFNGDGMSDILFENTSGEYAIWQMNGTSIIGGGDIGNPGGTWQFAGIGDYNGDGNADILFTDAAGDLAIWEMNGTSITGGGDIGNPGGTWHALGGWL